MPLHDEGGEDVGHVISDAGPRWKRWGSGRGSAAPSPANRSSHPGIGPWSRRTGRRSRWWSFRRRRVFSVWGAGGPLGNAPGIPETVQPIWSSALGPDPEAQIADAGAGQVFPSARRAGKWRPWRTSKPSPKRVIPSGTVLAGSVCSGTFLGEQGSGKEQECRQDRDPLHPGECNGRLRGRVNRGRMRVVSLI